MLCCVCIRVGKAHLSNFHSQGGLFYWYELSDISEYRQVSNIRRTLEGNNIVDHSDVVGASPVGAAPTTPSSST